MNQRTAHRQLYRKIPSLSCNANCRDCCGSVPVSPWEAERLGIDGDKTPTKPDSTKCAFSSPKGCTVYNKRPFMCRFFGVVDDHTIQCPHGHRTGKSLSKYEAEQLFNEYMALFP